MSERSVLGKRKIEEIETPMNSNVKRRKLSYVEQYNRVVDEYNSESPNYEKVVKYANEMKVVEKEDEPIIDDVVANSHYVLGNFRWALNKFMGLNRDYSVQLRIAESCHKLDDVKRTEVEYEKLKELDNTKVDAYLYFARRYYQEFHFFRAAIEIDEYNRRIQLKFLLSGNEIQRDERMEKLRHHVCDYRDTKEVWLKQNICERWETDFLGTYRNYKKEVELENKSLQLLRMYSFVSYKKFFFFKDYVDQEKQETLTRELSVVTQELSSLRKRNSVLLSKKVQRLTIRMNDIRNTLVNLVEKQLTFLEQLRSGESVKHPMECLKKEGIDYKKLL